MSIFKASRRIEDRSVYRLIGWLCQVLHLDLIIMAGVTKHRKFDEEAEALKDVPAEIPENDVIDRSSDEESEDEAPEEEGLSSSKSLVEKQELERQKAAEREEEVMREKRRKQNSRFTEQQHLKRQKQMQEFEALLKQREQAEKQEDDEDAVPEELPENFFDNLDQQDAGQITTKPTHVNFNDLDDENYSAEIREELQKQKKKTLRQLRKTTVKRGPVKVRLLASMSTVKTLAPQKDNTVLNKKDKWLKRKALGRKR
ncbi:LAME_0D00958g1_1 [Lachancea meyersii CBS 8951]|uniref:LAME_0D00958g1_1 n=1 Tax=Lachancea meyersii CBS 8951 TaxID=1266667 RepID=A0A1G4J6H8_9SACH|nr:LAME_0D00958g1_1 [Lachancea meyersii CBS 8951]